MKLSVQKMLYLDGEKVKLFMGKTDKYIENWVELFYPCARSIEVRVLRDVGRLPAPSRQPFNELFENYGAYRTNPFVSID